MSDHQKPVVVWFRRDLRLSDHLALDAAVQSGRPIVPLFICDDLVRDLGAAPRWRLELGLQAFADTLRGRGSRLVLRRGRALDVLSTLIAETGADTVLWSRCYEPATIKRDTEIKSELTARGIHARSFAGHLLFEPWEVKTKSDQPFRVFTPMWRSVQTRDVPFPAAFPGALRPMEVWPASDQLDDWGLGKGMDRGAAVVRSHVRAGETAALDCLQDFLNVISSYAQDRDRPDKPGTSRLSEYLSLGEVGPRMVWHAVQSAAMAGVQGTEPFLRQLVWREFAYHLMCNTPHILSDNWRSEWDQFPWNTDPQSGLVRAWTQARTGIPIVDAGLREMYVTGRMHNRVRMIVASYLTKHLATHWKIGMNWFAECLTDWDPAANALGWQWVAGSGPDAAPFFRIFNPETQRQRFDPNAAYVSKWIAEGQSNPGPEALSYFEAVPRSWALSPDDPYPRPVVELADGRKHALELYQALKTPVRN